jgi:hypothetical protein
MAREFEEANSSRFAERRRESEVAEYVLTEESAPKGVAIVEKMGDSWHTTVFSICQSSSKKGDPN